MSKVLVTGSAGFIGSHLVERLLKQGYTVYGVDNFINSDTSGVEAIYKNELLMQRDRDRYTFTQWDITDYIGMREIFKMFGQFSVVYHQAAVGSIPRSLENPTLTMHHNVTGFHTILQLCKEFKVSRLVYASSSSVYGTNAKTVKTEHETGEPLNPYALSKLINEQQAATWARAFGVESIGLRYFNVFGPRQCGWTQYSAVISKWLNCIKRGEKIIIDGTGEQMRDFTYIENVTYMNVLCGTIGWPDAVNRVYNVGAGEAVTLKALLREICHFAVLKGYKIPEIEHGPSRPGDVQATRADLSRAKQWLRYEPTHTWRQGVKLLCESEL